MSNAHDDYLIWGMSTRSRAPRRADDALVAVVGTLGFVYDRQAKVLHVRVFHAKAQPHGGRIIYVAGRDVPSDLSTERSRRHRARKKAEREARAKEAA